MAIDFPSSPTVGQQYTFGGVTYTFTAQGVWSVTAGLAGGVTTPLTPQGRLTLQAGTPVMTTTVASQAAIYYSPYCGNQIPIYNGTSWATQSFVELSVATTDTTKSPAVIGASKVNDWFVWNDAGTLRLGHGPDWTSDTARSAGTALVRVNGIWLNNASITNGPAASRGTYVGTTRSNASSQLDWIYGTGAAAGGAAFFGVWNAYNRRQVVSRTNDTNDSWTYSAATWRPSDNSTSMRCSFVAGLAEDAYVASFTSFVTASGGGLGIIGIALNSTTAIMPGAVGLGAVSALEWLIAYFVGQPVLGFNYVQAMENAGAAATTTFYGDFGVPIDRENSFNFEGWV